MKTLVTVIIVAAFWLITYPALNANFAAIGSCDSYKDMARQNLGVSMLFAALPPGWLVTPFLTGFYEHGLQFGTQRADCAAGHR